MPNPTVFDLWTAYVVLAALAILAVSLSVCYACALLRSVLP